MSDQFTPRLSEYLDDDLTPGERLEVQRHLPDCAECRATLDGLRHVVADAQALEDTPPAKDLWFGVRASLPAATRRRQITLSIPQALAAGILLAIVTALCVALFFNRQPAAAGESAGNRSSVGMLPIRVSDPKYDRAVDELTRLLDEERSHLSPKTVEAIEKSLTTIDKAIAEAQYALKKDPSDPFLNNHLAQQRRTKIALLRQVNQLARAGS
jgi:anti-sigma factor RsiW